MKLIGWLVVAAALLAAIALSGDSASRPAPGMSGTSRAGYGIALERTACFGTCPQFTLLIDGEGNTRLTMTAFEEHPREPDVAKAFLYGSKLSPERHSALIDAIERGGFRRLDPDYSAMVTDSASTTITIDTPRGRWSTHVYAVPCAAQATGWTESDRADWGIGTFVPDIFCELAARLDAVACDTYLHGTPLGPNHDLEPFRPPHCRSTP